MRSRGRAIVLGPIQCTGRPIFHPGPGKLSPVAQRFRSRTLDCKPHAGGYLSLIINCPGVMQVTTLPISYPPSDWQSACAVSKVTAEESYGSGVAALAMVAGIDYLAGRAIFARCGLAQRRKNKPALATNLSEMATAVATAGLMCEPRRWQGWQRFRGLGIVKIEQPAAGRRGRWTWAVSFTHCEYGIVLFDPHSTMPSFQRMPMDVECSGFDHYRVIGKWLQVENIHQPNP